MTNHGPDSGLSRQDTRKLLVRLSGLVRAVLVRAVLVRAALVRAGPVGAGLIFCIFVVLLCLVASMLVWLGVRVPYEGLLGLDTFASFSDERLVLLALPILLLPLLIVLVLVLAWLAVDGSRRARRDETQRTGEEKS